MRVLEPGHVYKLTSIDGGEPGILRFVKRTGSKYPGNAEPPHPGFTTQEVLRALIDRTEYVNTQAHWQENDDVLYRLRECLALLERRAARARNPGALERFTKNVAVHSAIETVPACSLCGHTFCDQHSCPRKRTGLGAA